MVVERSTDRKKRKLHDELNLLEDSGQKGCRTPLLAYERDKNIYKHFKINTTLFSKEPVIGTDLGEEQGSLCQGVGEFLGQRSGCSPESPARIGNVQPYGHCTASLMGEINV